MAFVSITRLRVRSPRFLFGFVLFVIGSVLQAALAKGNHRIRLHRTRGLRFWTQTVWDDATSMAKFRGGWPHRPSMPHLQHWCCEASVAHWVQPSIDAVSWAEAAERLQRDGRLSRVNFPSAAQRAGTIVVT